MSRTTAFRYALKANFGLLNLIPEGDGQIHRFHVPGDRGGSRNGWYILHMDGLATGMYGSWKTGNSHTWNSREPRDYHEAEQVRRASSGKPISTDAS